MKRTPDPFDTMIESWTGRNIPTRSGVSSEDIRAFERHYLVSLPDELRRYFRKANGMENTHSFCHDSHIIRFWNIPSESDILSKERAKCEVAPIPLAWPSAPERFQHLFILGDWNDMSAVFCAALGEKPWGTAEVFFYDGFEPMRLSYNFHEFVLRYIQLGAEAFTIRTHVID